MPKPLFFLCTAFSLISYSSFLKAEELAPRHMRVGLRHIENKGIGYNTGYSTVETFLAPFREEWSTIPFLDLRGHILNDGTLAANTGIGARTLVKNRTYGANAYYDYRQTTRQHYNQISLGLETLGIRWDYRLNGYLPVGKKNSTPYNQHKSVDYTFATFNENSLFLTETVKSTGKIQYAMKGLDAETAFHFLKIKNFDLSAAIGPYYYGYENKQAIGGKIRASAQIFDYLCVQLTNSYDSRFHERFQGSIGITVPFGKREKPLDTKQKGLSDSYFLRQRLVQSVEKQEIIVVDHLRTEKTSKSTSIAIDPFTKSPFNFLFINNTSNSLGTFASPYNTLLIAEEASVPYDIFYVFPGDGTQTGLDQGITLQDYQKLWGSGVSHKLTTTVGNILIPALSSSASFQNINPLTTLPTAPILTSYTGDVITLANSNEISGIYIINMEGHGITSPVSSITNLAVENNIIQGPSSGVSGAYGINLNNVSGTVLIDSNRIFEGLLDVNITALNIQNSTYVLSNNDASSFEGAFFMGTYTNSANISTIFSNNVVSAVTFVQLTLDNAVIEEASSIILNDNTINTVYGLRYTFNNSANADISITENNFNCVGGTLISFTQNNTSYQQLQASNNHFSSSHGIVGALANTSQMTGFISKNNAYTGSSLISFTLSDQSSIFDFSIADNTIAHLPNITSTEGAIYIETNNATNAEVSISTNDIAVFYNGITLTSFDNSSFTASLQKNTCSQMQQYGIILETTGESTGNWIVDQNSIFDPSGKNFLGLSNTGAILVQSSDTSVTTLDFTNNIASPLELLFLSPSPTVGAYQFTQNDTSTFTIPSLQGNIGVITETGF